MSKAVRVHGVPPLHCRAEILTLRFYNADNNFAIFTAKVLENLSKEEIFYAPGYPKKIVVKGTLFDPQVGDEVILKGYVLKHEQYGYEYQLSYAERPGMEVESEEGKMQFLARLCSPLQLENLYQTLDDPFQVIEDGRYEELLKVHGFGFKTAEKLVKKFGKNRDMYRIYAELYEYQLSDYAVMKLLEKYNSIDLVIRKIKENPYRILLDNIPGFGWKRVDKIALSGGMKKDSPFRIMGFIYYYLYSLAEEGDSWITATELMGGIKENIGQDIEPFIVTEAIHGLVEEDKIWSDEEHTKIGLKYYYNLAGYIAKDLIRLRDAKNEFVYDGWEERVKYLEGVQGFEFTKEQWDGIKFALESQVLFITGKSGTGKTSLVRGIFAALPDHYTHIITALAGRAASRLAEVTKEEGYTIHRALGYSPDKGFQKGKDNPLEEDVVVVDEVGMIGADLFDRLISATRTGAKLILLADPAQLPPIGIGNIAYDLMNSPHIPTIRLTKIHRQAEASAIITESIRISNGGQILSKDWVGKQVFGELKDLRIDAYSDQSNTFYRVCEHVQTAVHQGVSLDGIQVILPMKTRGDASVYNVNNTLQEMFNPGAPGKLEMDANYERDKVYTLRIGDRVINRKNNYSAQRWMGLEDKYFDVETHKYATYPVPVYNGNIGKVKEIHKRDRIIVIDFLALGEVAIQGLEINDIQLAYAITCHSAQGSEVDYVIVGIDFSAYTMLSRQWLYTAITRAKKVCVVCCQTSAFRYATSNNLIIVKRTHLQNRLKELCEVDEGF